MKPAMLDLFCGHGGATLGFQAVGWECFGVDVDEENAAPYPGHLVMADVKEVAKDTEAFFPALKFDFIWASPPCQEFSYRDLPFGRVRNLPPPDKSCWEAVMLIREKYKCPVIIENVRGAQKWMGKSVANYGSYHLWGSVPWMLLAGKPERKAIIPNGSQRCTDPEIINKQTYRFASTGKKRREHSAKAAMIPFELAGWIAEFYYPRETVNAGL